MVATVDQREIRRLSFLASLRLLESSPSELLTNLTLTAARLFDSPVCLLTQIDESKISVFAATGWSGSAVLAPASTYCERVHKTGKPLCLEDQSGSRMGIQFYAGTPLNSSEGFFIGTLCVFDFQPRQASAAQMECLALLAKQAVLAIEKHQQMSGIAQFAATLSHELRTPLNGILGAAELLAHLPQTPTQRELIQAIEGSGKLLLSLLNESLHSRKSEISERSFSLPELLNVLVRNFTPLANANQLQLDLVSDSAIPENVVGDPLRITQILNNLIGNAIKFTRPGGKISVFAEYTASLSNMMFAVRDTGVGIPEDLLPHIFEPYVQGPPSQFRNGECTGLGLSITRDIVEALGGVLKVESKLEVGTTATVTLFLPSVQAIPPGLRVLMVEDNPVNQFVARRLLTLLGCVVEISGDGVAALACLESRPFDLVLMDCIMQGMDGYEATRRIRSRQDRAWSRIPILALTGQASELDRQACLNAGMNGVVFKPLDLNSLKREMMIAIQFQSSPGRNVSARGAGKLPVADEGDQQRSL